MKTVFVRLFIQIIVVSLENQRFWSWMLKCVYMDGLDLVGKGWLLCLLLGLCVQVCVCDVCVSVGVRRSDHVRSLFMSVCL